MPQFQDLQEMIFDYHFVENVFLFFLPFDKCILFGRPRNHLLGTSPFSELGDFRPCCSGTSAHLWMLKVFSECEMSRADSTQICSRTFQFHWCTARFSGLPGHRHSTVNEKSLEKWFQAYSNCSYFELRLNCSSALEDLFIWIPGERTG